MCVCPCVWREGKREEKGEGDMIAQNSRERTEANVNDVVLVGACESCAERVEGHGPCPSVCQRGFARGASCRESPETQTSCLDALSRRMRPTQVDVAFAHVVPGMSETPVDSPTSISTEEATKAMEDPATPRIPDLQQAAKRVYFIRHAESEWNSGAKRGPMGILRALMKIDHPLTKKGYSQAAALQQALRDQPPDDLAGVLSAEAVWTSPQTRAVQTALVAFLPSLEKEDATAAVTLCPSVRERRNGAYSRDNVGGGVGEALRFLACDRLARLKADGVDSMRKAADPTFSRASRSLSPRKLV